MKKPMNPFVCKMCHRTYTPRILDLLPTVFVPICPECRKLLREKRK